MTNKTAKFQVGQLIHHKLFNYRGVVIDVDAIYSGTEEWYKTVARSHPPKDEPWYHLLVHQAEHFTYVAERNMEVDVLKKPIIHPFLNHFFEGMHDGFYISLHSSH